MGIEYFLQQLVNGICPKCSAPTDSKPPQA